MSNHKARYKYLWQANAEVGKLREQLRRADDVAVGLCKEITEWKNGARERDDIAERLEKELATVRAQRAVVQEQLELAHAENDDLRQQHIAARGDAITLERTIVALSIKLTK